MFKDIGFMELVKYDFILKSNFDKNTIEEIDSMIARYSDGNELNDIIDVEILDVK